jgi:hypothetical protein
MLEKMQEDLDALSDFHPKVNIEKVGFTYSKFIVFQ